MDEKKDEKGRSRRRGRVRRLVDVMNSKIGEGIDFGMGQNDETGS